MGSLRKVSVRLTPAPVDTALAEAAFAISVLLVEGPPSLAALDDQLRAMATAGERMSRAELDAIDRMTAQPLGEDQANLSNALQVAGALRAVRFKDGPPHWQLAALAFIVKHVPSDSWLFRLRCDTCGRDSLDLFAFGPTCTPCASRALRQGPVAQRLPQP